MNIHLSTDLPGGKVPYTCVRFFPLEDKGGDKLFLLTIQQFKKNDLININ